MQSSIGAARAEVQRAFDRVLKLADSDRQLRFFRFERGLWTLLLALGRALVSLFLAHQAARPRAAEYLRDKHRFVIDGERTSQLGTRFGKVSFTRRIARRRGAAGRGATDLPLDRELGLCSGFSVGLVMVVTRLCAQLAFGQARGTFRYLHEWAPSSRAVLRMVDTVGDQARPFLEQLPGPLGDGDVLVVEVDARGAPMITPAEHQRRRARRKRSLGSTRRHRRRHCGASALVRAGRAARRARTPRAPSSPSSTS
jgi:hypothetical protein